MLRLLARREEGYEDIAALMGLSVEEVRGKVKEALSALDREEAPAKSSPAQPAAAPEPRKAAVPPQGDPLRAKVASRAPRPASAKPARRERSRERPSDFARRLSSKLPTDRRVRVGALAAAAALVVLIVLLATGVFGGEDSTQEPSTAQAPSGSSKASFNSRQVTGAVLEPEGDSDAIGRAILGRAGKEPLLQIEAEGLDPSEKDEAYTVWLYKSPGLVLRVGAVEVDKGGGIAAQFPLPVEVVKYIAASVFDQIYVSRTSDAAYQEEVSTAKREKRLPRYTGTTVLHGQIEGPLLSVAEDQGG